MTTPTLGFVGGGRMAEAMIDGLLRRDPTSRVSIVVADVSEARRSLLAARFGIRVVESNQAVLEHASTVVLAVKPDKVSAVCAELTGRIEPATVVLSIVAGLRVEDLQKQLAHGPVARAIPNTPAQIGAGTTVWFAPETVTDEQRARVRRVLEATGMELEVGAERFVEMATGLTSPTPAFVFLFVEALTDAGVALGFPREQAQALVTATVLGSAELLRQTGEHPAVLRGHVTSPGGATVAGLRVLERAGVRAALDDAVQAVFQRALELSPADQKR